jgi:hypothetical protein
MAVVAAAVVGCGQKGGGKPKGPQPADAFGLADANVIVRGNPSGILSSKFYVDVSKAVASMPMLGGGGKSVDDMLKETLGLDPADVKCVVAHANVEGEKFVVTAVSKKPIDRDAVIASLAKQGPKLEKQETYAGVDLFAETADDNEVMAFPKADIVVAGTKDEVKKGIDRLKAGKAVQLKGKIASVLGAAPKGADLVVVVVPTPELTQMAAGSAPMPGAAEVAEKVTAVTVAVKSADSLDLNVIMELETDKDAEKLRTQAKEGAASLKVVFGQAAGQPPMELLTLAGIKKLLSSMLKDDDMEPIKNLIDSITVGGTGKCADFKASVPADITKTFPALMGLVMAQMMGGGGGMGGGMPGGM